MIQHFYSYFRSSTAYRLRIALNLKGITPAETHYVNLLKGEQRTPEYRAVNPMGALPAFVLADGTVLTQSLAMLEWLEETHPTPALLPQDPVARVEVRAFAQIIGCDIHPVNNLRILNYITGELGADDAAKKQWIHHWLHQAFPVLEQMVVAQPGPFCFGDTASLADICLVPQWFNAERFGLDLSAYPKLAAITAHCRTLDAFTRAAPENQPDAI